MYVNSKKRLKTIEYKGFYANLQEDMIARRNLGEASSPPGPS
jgi:hypothetical protein